MPLFRKILAEHEANEKYKYELANPCKYDSGTEPPFVWDGQTMCFVCCKHEYSKLIEVVNGFRICTLIEPEYDHIRLRTRRAPRKNVPRIRLYDADGKIRRVRYQ